MLSYRRETALQAAKVLANRGRPELGDNIWRTLLVYLQPLWHNQPAKMLEFSEKRNIRVITQPFKVIEVGNNRKPECHFLLFRSYRSLWFEFWTLRFRATLWGLRNNARCLSWTHWKARSGVPISDNWSFFAMCYGWGATSESRSKICDFAPMRSFWPKISGRRGRPHQSFFTHS